jgi:hypothetical protein
MTTTSPAILTMSPEVVAVAVALAAAALGFWIAIRYRLVLDAKRIVALGAVAVVWLRLAGMIGGPSSPPAVMFVRVIALSAALTFAFAVGTWAARSQIAARRGGLG